jgi:holo-[acyl-carrier protein] synthase
VKRTVSEWPDRRSGGMIIGHGVDLVEHESFAKLVAQEEAFLKRCFSESEIAVGKSNVDSVQWFASRFAAKESVMKALGTGRTQGISFHEIQLQSGELGRPELRLSGKAQEIATKLGILRWVISLSHARHASIASVIAT